MAKINNYTNIISLYSII